MKNDEAKHYKKLMTTLFLSTTGDVFKLRKWKPYLPDFTCHC